MPDRLNDPMSPDELAEVPKVPRRTVATLEEPVVFAIDGKEGRLVHTWELADDPNGRPHRYRLILRVDRVRNDGTKSPDEQPLPERELECSPFPEVVRVVLLSSYGQRATFAPEFAETRRRWDRLQLAVRAAEQQVVTANIELKEFKSAGQTLLNDELKKRRCLKAAQREQAPVAKVHEAKAECRRQGFTVEAYGALEEAVEKAEAALADALAEIRDFGRV